MEYYILKNGTNIRITKNGVPIIVNGYHIGPYLRSLNASKNTHNTNTHQDTAAHTNKYVALPVIEYKMKYMPHKINAEVAEDYFLVRIGTNERLKNKSEDINVCKAEHLPKILNVLNRNKRVWEPMRVRDYYEKFGAFTRLAQVIA